MNDKYELAHKGEGPKGLSMPCTHVLAERLFRFQWELTLREDVKSHEGSYFYCVHCYAIQWLTCM